MHRHSPVHRALRAGNSLNAEQFSALDDGEGPTQSIEEPSRPSGRVNDVFDFQGNDPLSQLLHDESTQLIARALESLPSMQRLCVVLSFYDNLSLHRIAELLGVSSERASLLRRRGLKRVGIYLRRFQ